MMSSGEETAISSSEELKDVKKKIDEGEQEYETILHGGEPEPVI